MEYMPLTPSQMEQSSSGEVFTFIRSTETASEKTRRRNPHQKYSSKWFGHAWDRAVEVGRWPRLLYLAIGSLLIGGWIGTMYVLFSLLYTALMALFL
jgi:hypothetical protein